MAQLTLQRLTQTFTAAQLASPDVNGKVGSLIVPGAGAGKMNRIVSITARQGTGTQAWAVGKFAVGSPMQVLSDDIDMSAVIPSVGAKYLIAPKAGIYSEPSYWDGLALELYCTEAASGGDCPLSVAVVYFVETL